MDTDDTSPVLYFFNGDNNTQKFFCKSDYDWRYEPVVLNYAHFQFEVGKCV